LFFADYDGNPLEAQKGSLSSTTTQLHPHDTSRTAGTSGQKAVGVATTTPRKAGTAGTQSQKLAVSAGSAILKPSLGDSKINTLKENLDLEDVDPFTAEKIIEQQELQQLGNEDGAGAFSSSRNSDGTNRDNNEFLDTFDGNDNNDDSNGVGFNELPKIGSISRPAAAAVGGGEAVTRGKSNSGSATTTGAAIEIRKVARPRPSQVGNVGNSSTTTSVNASNKQGAAAAAVSGADLWNDDYSAENGGQGEDVEQEDIDYSAGEDSALRKIGGSGDVFLRPVNTATVGAKTAAANDDVAADNVRGNAATNTQATAKSFRPGISTKLNTSSTTNSSVQQQQQQQQQGGVSKLVAAGGGAAAQQQQQMQQKSSITDSTTTAVNQSGATTTTIAKQQASTAAGNHTATAARPKTTTAAPKKTTAGATNATSNTNTPSTVSGEARNRRAGSAGGVLPGHGGEEPPENMVKPIKVGANKPGEKPSFDDETETESDESSSADSASNAATTTTTTTNGSKPANSNSSLSTSSLPDAATQISGQVASVLPTGPKSTAEAMIRSQKLGDDEGVDYSNEDGVFAREKKTLPADEEEEEEKEVADDEIEIFDGPAEKSSIRSTPAISNASNSPSGSKSGSTQKPSSSASSAKKEATSKSSKEKTSTSSKPSSSSSSSLSSGKKPSKGMRRSLRSEIPVVRLKKHPQPYAEAEDRHVGEGNQRRRTVPV
jgi:trimeric autotransporter adhesin